MSEPELVVLPSAAALGSDVAARVGTALTLVQQQRDRAALALTAGSIMEQVWAELIKLLDQMADIMGDELVSPADFLAILESVLEQFDLAQSTVSQHLKVLVDAGLVRFSSERQRSCYCVDREALNGLVRAVNALFDQEAAPPEDVHGGR